MKYKSYVYIIILIVATLLATWAVPFLTKKLTYKPDEYPFVHYSSILKELCFIEFKNKTNPLHDKSGNVYTTAQFDSLMPLLNFRQLMADGNLPDSIDGHEINPQILRAKSVVFHHGPEDIYTPSLGLYIMFESMPKRLGIEIPNDVFRMKDNIQFINPDINTVNKDKSALFEKALNKEGFQFPAQWIAGNMNPKKPYDEGYFCLDDKGQLFHLKMVNNRPFVRNTHCGDSIDIAYFAMQEVGDKRFYGYLFDKQGHLYIIESQEGKYKPLKLDIDPIDIKNDKIMIMGNLLYWSVSITTPYGEKYYALETESLRQVDNYSVERTLSKWDSVSKWLFPFYFDVSHENNDYIYPCIIFTSYYAIILNFVLAIIVLLFVPNTRNRKIFNSSYILITGIAGFIALLILPGFLRKQYKKE